MLAWDGQDGLLLFNHAERLQAQRSSPVPIAAACCAEDGSAYAVGGAASAGRLLVGPGLGAALAAPAAAAGHGDRPGAARRVCRRGRRRLHFASHGSPRTDRLAGDDTASAVASRLCAREAGPPRRRGFRPGPLFRGRRRMPVARWAGGAHRLAASQRRRLVCAAGMLRRRTVSLQRGRAATAAHPAGRGVSPRGPLVRRRCAAHRRPRKSRLSARRRWKRAAIK